VEATVNYLATELLKLEQELEEILFHELVDQAVEQGIVELGFGGR